MSRSLCVVFALCFVSIPALRATPPIGSTSRQDQQQDQPPPQSQDQVPYQDQSAPYENFSPDQLDNLLSPIALYPDPLLAQVFVAATFPDQVEEAARYVRSYGQNGVDEQNWDVSVKAVAHYPTVIEMMSDKIDWTTSLGQAYVNQSTDIAASVQRLRHLARHAGNLDSSRQEEVLEHGDYIAITPYEPQYIYVPVYDPAIIYYRRPYWGPAITFGVGYPIGAWLNLDFRWGYGGGWGGVYYTGWRREGWGGDCWNCGWIGRSRERVDIRNNVYINNRYTNITVNRTVINRTVNVNNINRYNSVHRDVRYDNVQKNNMRVERNGGPGGNRSGNFGNNGRPGGGSPGENRPGVNNKIIDRNIDRGNPRIDQYRGRDNSNNNVRNDRPPNNAQPNRPNPGNNDMRFQNRNSGQNQGRPTQPNSAPPNRPNPGANNDMRIQNRNQGQDQGRPAQPNNAPPNRPNPGANNDMRFQNRNAGQNQGRPAQPSVNNGPHTFNRNENNFDPRVTSQRGQSSRQEAVRPQQPAARPAPQPRAENRPVPAPRGGGERKKP
jgi:hypothetical protein